MRCSSNMAISACALTGKCSSHANLGTKQLGETGTGAISMSNNDVDG